MKRALVALLSMFSSVAHANVTIPYTFTAGQTIPSMQVNADFSAVASEINSHENAVNPHNTTLAQILTTSNSCGSNPINFNFQQAQSMEVENLANDPSPGNAGRVWINTTTHLLKFDDGSNVNTVGGSGSNNLSSVLNSGNSAGAFNINMNGNQILSMLVENRTSDPSAAAGRLYYRTDNSTLNVCSGASCTAVGGAQGLASVLGVSNSAGSTAINFNGQQAKSMVMDSLSSDPGSPTSGQLWYNTTTHIPKFYNGTSSLAVGNTNTLAQTLALGATTGGTNIDFAGAQAQHMVVWNNAGSPGTGTGGYLWFDTGNNSLNYETSTLNHRVCSLDGTETLTNKSIDGGSNTLTNIADSSLSTNVDLLNGNQTITGTKTFTGAPIVTRIKTPTGVTLGHQVPDGLADDTFVLANATQTLSGKTLSGPAFTNNSNFNNYQANNFRVENRSGNPAAGNAGRIYFNTNTGELRYEDGTSWHALAAGGLTGITGNSLSITGTSDIVTGIIQGNGTQTNPIFEVLKSDSSVLFSVSNAGNASIAGVLTTNALGSGALNPATAGAVRLASSDTIAWRNNANSANVALGKDSSDQLSYAGTSFLSSSGVLLAAGFPALTGDVTTSAGSLTTAVAKINGTAVSGTTGSTNVVFSAAPTITGAGSLTAASHISSTANAASAGAFRLADADLINWRNHANGADISLGKSTTDQLTWGGTALFSSTGVQQAASFPALTGDITTSAGSLATSYNNLVPLAKGGTNVDLSATGGTSQVLKQNSSHVISVAQLGCSDLSNASTSCSTDATNASNISSGTLAVARGGTNASTASAATYFGGPYTGSAAAPAFHAFQAPVVQVLTGSGTYTPTAGSLWADIWLVGPGGGGGSSASGGGSGNNGSAASTLAVGTTTFSAGAGNGGAKNGGTPGTGGAVSPSSTGADGTGVTVLLAEAGAQGGAGTNNGNSVANVFGVGGPGGVSCLGGNGMPAAQGTTGQAATGPGSGGAGGSGGSAVDGGSGGGSGACLHAIVTNAASGYSSGWAYVVGTKGTGNATSVAGGNGMDGTLIAIDHFQ